MYVIKKEYDLWGRCRAHIEGDSGEEYITTVDLNGPCICSCAAFVFNGSIKNCKHIKYLWRNVERDKMINKVDELTKIPTGSKIIDDLLGGGVPMKLVTALFSVPACGKSWMGYQTGVNNIKVTGKETLLIDTEGITIPDLNNILNKLRLRFDLTEKEVQTKFKMIKTYDDPNMLSIQKLLMMFGFFVKLELSDNGKYKVTFQPCEATLEKEQLESTSLIILDSLTKPIKDSVGSETSNLPARAQIIERMFGRLHHIAQVYNIAVFVLHHASCPPPVGYPKAPYAYGGNPVYYNSKYILELLDSTKKERNIKCAEDKEKKWNQEARRVILRRRPDEQPTGDKIPIRLRKDIGFVDG